MLHAVCCLQRLFAAWFWCVARVLAGSAVVICECVGGTVMGGCCVLIAVLRVASIGIRTACGAIAFSVLALVPMLIRVAVLAFFVQFASSIPCWAVLALFVSWFIFSCCQFSISFN